jgi:hypothetical protein
MTTTSRVARSRKRDISGVGAGAAQDGYTYQLNVSILAALDLMLAKKFANQITLEPANEEDLSADLAPAAPGRVQPAADNDQYELVVQVKLHNTGPWDLAGFKALLKHGKAREPAKKLLDDPRKRFLLVTNADVSGTLRGIIAADFDDWPAAAAFPGGLSAILPNSPEGRVAIWTSLAERDVQIEIDLLLGELLHIPDTAFEACREDLRREARLRMRGSSPGVWTRDDLVATIRAHGGYLASAPELDVFVKPANWIALTKRLQMLNAVVITGPSGTGKTWAAIALCEWMRDAQSRLDVVTLSGEPSAARSIVNRGPTLYYIEDPWGQYSLRTGSEAWSEQLPRMLREVRGNKNRWYVVTTRSDMLRSGRGDSKLADWTIEIDADQYADGQLAAIHDKRMGALTAPLQTKALHFRPRALETLKTPLEVDIYFGGFANGPLEDEIDEIFFQRVIGLAHRDAIEATVALKLAAADPVGWSPVLWALLVTRSGVERAALVAVQAAMRRVDPTYRDGLERLTNTLVAARHLRQPASTISFAHPSIKAGFESFVKEEPGRTKAVIEQFLTALTELDDRWREWGLETAARVFAMAKGRRDEDPPVAAAARRAIDAWIDDTLMSGSEDFGKVLELASNAGSADSIPSELARWFLHGTRRGGQVFNDRWQPPTFDDGWYDRVAADPRSREISARFVREVLPAERDSYGRGFPVRLDRIVPGLAPDFAEAAMAIVSGGFDSNVGTIALGAVRDLDAFAPVLDAALDELASDHRQQEAFTDHWVRIENGEFDKSEEEHFQRSHEDDGYSAGVMVDTYVQHARVQRGWQALAAHPRAPELARAWARAVGLAAKKPSFDEAIALIAAARKDETEWDAWRSLRQKWPTRLTAKLRDRVIEAPVEPDLRKALAECLVTVGAPLLSDMFGAFAGTDVEFLTLLVDVRSAAAAFAKGRKHPLNIALTAMPTWAQTLYHAISVKKSPPQPIDSACAERTEAYLTGAPELVLSSIVPILIESGARPISAIGRWLDMATSSDGSREAVEAAARIGDTDLLRRALTHEFAGARGAALRALAPPPHEALPRDLIALVGDPGSGVRLTLVSLLARSQHPSNKTALLRLSRDTWSDAEAFYDEEPRRPIAQRAIEALSAYSLITTAEGDGLIAVAQETPDKELRALATKAAADRSTAEVRARLWDIGLEDVARWIRVDAIDALALARSVEPELTAGVTVEILLEQPPVVAVAATCLLARHGDPDNVLKIVERVGHSSQHRALLLVAATVLAERDLRGIADQLMGMLPANHPAGRLLELGPDDTLPADAIDDLGHVRLRSAVGRYLGPAIIKPR